MVEHALDFGLHFSLSAFVLAVGVLLVTVLFLLLFLLLFFGVEGVALLEHIVEIGHVDQLPVFVCETVLGIVRRFIGKL